MSFPGYSTPNFDSYYTFNDLFLDNSYSSHPIGLKHGGQLDYEVMQRILFPGYSTPNFDKSYCSSLISFPAHPYSFHLIRLICMLLDRKKMWKIAARLWYTKFSYSFEVTVHQIFSYYLLRHPHLLSG